MSQPLKKRLLAVGVCSLELCFRLAAQAADVGPIEPRASASLSDFGAAAWNATDYVFRSPLHWDNREWSEFGGETLAVLGTMAALDQPLQKAAQRNRNSGVEHFANHFERFGREYSAGVLGAFYLGGLVVDDNRAKLVAEDGAIASILAGLTTAGLERITGRSRPGDGRGTRNFSPFSSHASFPSGHATQAFAVASVIAARYDDNPWIDTAAYGVAALVGVARIDHHAHFTSDVLAGALIGNAIGRAVVHSRSPQHPGMTFTPVAAPRFSGFVGSIDF